MRIEADPLSTPPTDASRLGEAMHWLLENAHDSPEGWRPERLSQARTRYALTPDQASRAEALARRIFTGEAAWAWSADEVLQAGELLWRQQGGVVAL